MDLLTIVYAVFGIGFLIFVHELGHFLAAKRVGVRVETFALGFQPTIFGFKARLCAFQWGETEYVIGMLRKLFGFSPERSYQLAEQVDEGGRVVLDTTTLERAEFKRDQIHAFGRDWRIPRCVGSMSAAIEPAPD